MQCTRAFGMRSMNVGRDLTMYFFPSLLRSMARFPHPSPSSFIYIEPHNDKSRVFTFLILPLLNLSLCIVPFSNLIDNQCINPFFTYSMIHQTTNITMIRHLFTYPPPFLFFPPFKVKINLYMYNFHTPFSLIFLGSMAIRTISNGCGHNFFLVSHILQTSYHLNALHV